MSTKRATSVVTRLFERLRPRRRSTPTTAEQVLPAAATWLWVIREGPTTVREVGERGWWTCHKDTREGDLALVYRTAPNKDIAYVVRALSDAFHREPDDGIGSALKTACDYVVVAILEPSLGFDPLKQDLALAEWGALNANFVGGVHRIPGGIWQHLLGLLHLSPTLLRELSDGVLQDYCYEREIEEQLFRDPARFARAGYRDVTNIERQERFPNGRIADLILTMLSGPAVVVELKRGQVKLEALDQLEDYRTSLHERLGGRRPPRGLLVGSDLHPKAKAALKRLPDVAFVPLKDLGFRRSITPSPSPRARKGSP